MGGLWLRALNSHSVPVLGVWVRESLCYCYPPWSSLSLSFFFSLPLIFVLLYIHCFDPIEETKRACKNTGEKAGYQSFFFPLKAVFCFPFWISISRWGFSWGMLYLIWCSSFSLGVFAWWVEAFLYLGVWFLGQRRWFSGDLSFIEVLRYVTFLGFDFICFLCWYVLFFGFGFGWYWVVFIFQLKFPYFPARFLCESRKKKAELRYLFIWVASNTMEGCSRKDEVCPQLLDLISKDREWVLKSGEGRSHGSPEEKKLELRLGPPGEDWTIKDNTNNNNCRERDESLRYLRYLSSMASMTHNCSNNNNNSNIINNTTTSCGKRGFLETVERNTGEEGWIMNSNGNQNQKQAANNTNNNGVLPSPWSSSGYQVKTQQQQQQTKASFLQFQSSPPVVTKESSQPCCTKVVDLQNTEKKAFSPASANTAVPNSSQKRYPSFSHYYYFLNFLDRGYSPTQSHCFIYM